VPSTIGQVIINSRQVIPDMPQVMAPPILISLTPKNTTGGTVTQGITFYVVLTATNQYGETISSQELSFNLTAPNNSVLIDFFGPTGNTSQYNIYIGQGPGEEKAKVPFTAFGSGPDTQYTFLGSETDFAATPPQRSTAWLPDTDGQLVGAGAIYGWLNDGLRLISRFAGGLLDYSGVRSNANQPYYQITGEWNKITSIWYDGYWMVGGDRGQFWRRNNITSQILSSATISVINNQMILEVYPQPARTGAGTILAAPMGAGDTTLQVNSTAGFVLPFGFLQIDSDEIMAYQKISSPNFVGLLRGLGGTVASAHAAGLEVKELNIFWSGKRQIEPSYAPGQSLSILPLPSGWDVLLAQYISGRAKNIEHDGQYWKQLQDDIKAQVKEWVKDEMGIMKRRQIGPPASPATYYADQAGGVLIN
jgi:hypothetical protein